MWVLFLLFFLHITDYSDSISFKAWELPKDGEKCFCQLSGTIDDCCCTVQSVTKLNTIFINSRIKNIVQRDYFRYFRLLLNRKCPFWKNLDKCARRACVVDKCDADSLPAELKHTYVSKGGNKYAKSANTKDPYKTTDHVHESHSENENYPCSGDKHLGALNKTISDDRMKAFKDWNTYDADSSYCVNLEEDSDEAVWIDLFLNPEQFTGYAGRAPHQIWNSIYKENCFVPIKKIQSYDDFYKRYLSKTCLEKRVFYRVVSGLHASINIHLSYYYPIGKNTLPTKSHVELMAPNPEEFHKRFHPDRTKGQGPYWLKNLYFTYLLTLRAVIKAGPYWRDTIFYTGNIKEDLELKQVILDLIKTSKTCPSTFDESQMFTGDPKKAEELKEEFRTHFKNITRIMDCVGCERCRLWGKIQTSGLATALKILFSSDKWDEVPLINAKRFSLTRTEIVSLFQSLCKFSNSLLFLKEFEEHVKR